jgi:hypothetical protein
MSDDNVIAFRARRSKQANEASAAPEGPSDAPPAIAGPPSESSQPGQAEPSPAPRAETLNPVPGQLIWLHCPTCGTIEYTELPMPGGRRHKCGTIVEEAVVDIDVRAEMTLAQANLRQIEAIGQLLEQHRQRYVEYERRLELIAGRRPEPYALDEERLTSLPVAEVDPLGLLISHALHNPTARFQKKDKP